MATRYDAAPVPSDTVVCPSCIVRISAPAEHVWKIFSDTSTYPEWNRFVPRMDVSSGSARETEASSSRVIHQDAKIVMHVSLKEGQAPSPNNARVTRVEAPDSNAVYRACWTVTGYPSFMLRTNRTTEIETIGDRVGGDAGTKAECEVRSWDVMAGPAAHIVKRVMPGEEALQTRFIDFGNDLKAYAERTWRQQAEVETA